MRDLRLALAGVLVTVFVANAQGQSANSSTNLILSALSTNGPVFGEPGLLQAQPDSGVLFLGCTVLNGATNRVLQVSWDLSSWQAALPSSFLSSVPPPPPLALLWSLKQQLGIQKQPSGQNLRIVPVRMEPSQGFFRLAPSEVTSNAVSGNRVGQ